MLRLVTHIAVQAAAVGLALAAAAAPSFAAGRVIITLWLANPDGDYAC